MSLDYEYFKEKMLELTGFDLHGYKEKQIRRRLGTLMKSLGAEDFRAYYQILKREPAPEAVQGGHHQRLRISKPPAWELQESTCRSMARQGCPGSGAVCLHRGRSLYPGHHFPELGSLCPGHPATPRDERPTICPRVYIPGALPPPPPGPTCEVFPAENHRS